MQKQAERWHGNYRMGIVLFLYMASSSIVTNPAWRLGTTLPTQEHFAPYCYFRQLL